MNTTPDPTRTDPSTTDPTTTDPAVRRRRTTVAGVAAGLLAGGAIGLVATVPSLTSASSADTADDAVVALQAADDTGDTGDAPADRPEPGERLREALQPLVDDGTIDTAQADAVATHLAEMRPERGERGHRIRAARHAPMVAELIGIDVETLRTELEAGRSIADVAEANGVDPQVVVDGLVADAQAHIDLAIDHGLDEERAAERLERVTERIEESVYRTPGGGEG